MSDGAAMDGPLSPELARLLERVAAEDGALPDPTLLPAAEGRAQALRTNARWNVNLSPMAAVAEATIAGNAALDSPPCRATVLIPPNAAPGAVLYVHGGGFAFCSPETHERCGRVLAIECGLPVVLPDYRLAPEHPFPAGLHDIVAALRGVFRATADLGVQRGPLLVAGDSAGANLALAAMLHEERKGRPLPDGALLFYGNYARAFETPSYKRFAEGPGLTRDRMRRYWDWYAGGRAIEAEPLASPLIADDQVLAALPPLYLMAAAVDPLLSDTLILHEQLTALSRDDELSVIPGVNHGFLQMTNELEAAREALALAGRAARRIAGPLDAKRYATEEKTE